MTGFALADQCDRCRQPKPLAALFAITFGPFPWDATEYRAVLCLCCHQAVAQRIEEIDALTANALDGSPFAEQALLAAMSEMHTTVFGPAMSRRAAEEAAQ